MTVSLSTDLAIAADAIRRGQMVIVDHGESAQLVVGAEFATPAAINFMAKEGRGVICLALTAERSAELGLELIPPRHRDADGALKPFTVSIEARHGVGTGVSAADRARTIAVAIDPGSRPEDLVTPGHVFPLQASRKGLLDTPGEAEAAIELTRLARIEPAAAICTILADDGHLATAADLLDYRSRFDLVQVSVGDLLAERR
jgi:3,4-dihydroxy 2-butanone 4-phosphate synthase / GTP cyclohydrolase II